MDAITLFYVVGFASLLCCIILLAIERHHQRIIMSYKKEIAKINFVIKCKEAGMLPDEIKKEWDILNLK